MKFSSAGAFALAVALVLAPLAGEAKRLGGGKSTGMQRSAPAQTAPQSPPPTQAAPAPTPTAPTAAPAAAGATAAAAAAAPAKRSWMGPIAGLAAGLGIAALLSHFGMGEAFANMLMVVLLAVAAFFLVRFLMRRFAGGGAQPALATPAGRLDRTAADGAVTDRVASPTAVSPQPAQAPMARSAFTPAASDVSVTGQPLPALGGAASEAAAPTVAAAAPGATALKLPGGFDLPAFERVAKMIFIRLQAANDTGDLDDLRQFTTPEMFAAIRMDLMERGSAPQRTDVERVDATVVDFAREDGRQIVSVRFQGLVKEDAATPASAFDEVWHLVKPESEGTWAIAGIQQPQ